ncbi:Chaperone protein focC precursor [Leminorella richardii]|uniref:Chaperone protein focC n=1 Tax=Leminorella richardii TaxID=158841 RepID=A0A2X4V775_9GAMM|nr:molecular chaperone [Leminorella richardii]SQI44038.1 Chaperone protein focC precursor [Leminorella richardii]
MTLLTNLKTFKRGVLIASAMGAFLLSAEAYSAVRPQLTRIVAYAEDKETPIEVVNESQETYLIQSWLEDLKGNENGLPLVLTPPVMKIGGKQEGKLRLVVLPGEIPQDRESVYWLSIQEIPPKAKDGGDNKLVLAIRSRLKVFVRPKGLDGTKASDAVKSLSWSVEREGGDVWLKATNPTPYHVSFGKLELKAGGAKGITLEDKIQMPPPMGSQRYAVPKSLKGKSVTITYSGVNDYGGETEVLSTGVKL